MQNLNVLQLNNVDNYFAEFCMNSGVNSESTFKAYQTDCNQIANHLFRKDMKFVSLEEIQSLKVNDIVRLQDAMAKSGLKASTINRKLKSLNSYFNFLRSNGIEVTNVVGGVRNKKKVDEEQHQVITLEHFQELKNHVNRIEIKMLFETALLTGLRRDGLFSITKKDLFLKEGKYFVKAVEKGSSVLVRQVTEEIYNFIMESEKDFPLYVRPNTLTDIFKDFESVVGVKYSLHSIRKLAINEVMSKSDLKTAQQFANHASPSTTLGHYLKNNDDSEEIGYKLISADEVQESDFDKYTKDDMVDAIMKLSESDKKKILDLLNK